MSKSYIKPDTDGVCDPLLGSIKTRRAALPVAACLFALLGQAHGQEVGDGAGLGPRRALSIVPRVSISETLTNNVGLTSIGQQADQITEISPGVQVSIDGARLKGFLDYSLVGVYYAQNSSARQFQNSLNSSGTFEAIDHWAFIDFSGNISRQAISALGAQTPSNVSVSANQSEVSSYYLSPYLRGTWGTLAEYEARYGRTVAATDAGVGSDVTTTDGIFKIKGGGSFKSLGWFSEFSHRRDDYSLGRATEGDRVNLGVSYSVSPQLEVLVSLGRESNNYTTVDKQSHSTNGLGLSWAPSEVTKLSAFRENRSFGTAHSLSFDHRTARTAWKFTDSKDIAASSTQLGSSSVGAVYDLLFAQFATLQPDPILRAQLVNAYMQANGLSSASGIVGGFLTSALSLQRRQDLSFALLGVRDTVTFFSNRSETRRLDPISTAVDDLSNSQLVRQRGFGVNYAHRLTPDYSLGILVSQEKTSGSLSTQGVTLRTLLFNIAAKLGKVSTASLAARRTVSSDGGAPYSETAFTATLNARF